MKKLMKGALFLALIGTLIVGCEKDESLSSSVPSNENLNKVKTINNKDGGNITYISANNFDVEFDEFAEVFFDDHPNGLIELEYLQDNEQYALTTEDIGPIDPITTERIICRSSDKDAVIGCAQRYVRFSIEGCPVTVSQHSSGMAWVAETNC